MVAGGSLGEAVCLGLAPVWRVGRSVTGRPMSLEYCCIPLLPEAILNRKPRRTSALTETFARLA